MSSHPYHTIFFDMGGTVIKPSPSAGAVYAEVAARYGIHVEAAEVDRMARGVFALKKVKERREENVPHTISLDLAKNYWREVVRQSFGKAADSPRFEAFYQAVFEEFAQPGRYELFPEAGDLLDELAGRGFRLGVISNWDERLRGILIGMDLMRRFESVVISGEVKIEKPAAGIFDAARKMCGAPEGAALLHIGDHPVEDGDGGRAAGFEVRIVDRAKGETLKDLFGDLL